MTARAHQRQIQQGSANANNVEKRLDMWAEMVADQQEQKKNAFI
ncbi:hypothetical protein [Domibacillus aminovorans]|nr:hypothetical protein [Domibacillus aminovorans]